VRLPVALLVILAACGSRAAPERILHDLVALAPHAEHTPGKGPAGSQIIAVALEDARDRFAPVRCPSGHALVFRDLRVGGPSRLELAFGFADPAQQTDGPPARFRVEAWRAPHDEHDPPDAVLERSFTPRELPDAGLAATLPLGDDPGTLTLRLSTESGGSAAWPAFLSPRILGVPADRTLPPALLDEPTEDLLARLPEATVVHQAPGAPVTRAAVDTHVGLAASRRDSLLAPAPARVSWKVTPPAEGALRFAVGVETAAWQHGGDGVTCAVEVDGERIWERRLHPHDLARDRGWKSVRLDLQRWAGREVALDLLTEPGASAADDQAAFALPTVVQAREVPPLTAAEVPTLVVLVVDTLRADRLEEQTMPRLHALALSGLRFRRARTVSSWTWPSTASLLTGRAPNEHGVHDSERSLLPDGLDTLAELCAARGYVTGAFVANALVAEENGFAQGFGTFVCQPNATARALADRALAWMDATEGAARLLYVHLFDPHVPYEPPTGFAAPWPADLPHTIEEIMAAQPDEQQQQRILKELRTRYDAEARYADTALGELLDALHERGALHDALVVVTADHGEEFREHGAMAHGPHLYDETLRVPLVITGYGPHVLRPTERDEPVTLQDVLPTLVDLAGLPAPAEPLPGRSLREPVPPGPVFAHTFSGLEPGLEGFTEKLSVVNDSWKLILTPASGRAELFDLIGDPGETRDLAAAEPQRRDILRGFLLDWETSTRARAPDNAAPPDEGTLQRLRALGYLGR
jgi:arylsulfatase A-like enzyme